MPPLDSPQSSNPMARRGELVERMKQQKQLKQQLAVCCIPLFVLFISQYMDSRLTDTQKSGEADIPSELEDAYRQSVRHHYVCIVMDS